MRIRYVNEKSVDRGNTVGSSYEQKSFFIVRTFSMLLLGSQVTSPNAPFAVGFTLKNLSAEVSKGWTI